MAASLYSFMSTKPINAASSEADFREVLGDFFCGKSKDPAWFTKCKADLENAVANNTGFSTMRIRNDYSLECDFKGCEQVFRCTRVNGVPQKKTCTWVAPGCPEGAAPNSSKCFVKNTKKMTAGNEYRAYLEGHRLLQGSPSQPPPAATCFSSTLQRDVAQGTCVQSKRDRVWYRCENSGWKANDGNTGCVARHPLAQ
jgi:hypothetical protein